MDQNLENALLHMKQALDLILEKMDVIKKHEEAIYGNGKVGLVTRLDRLEQRAESHKWILGISLAAFFTAIAEGIARVFKL